MVNYFQIIESRMPLNDGLPLIPDYKPQPNYQIGEILSDQYEIKECFHGSHGDVYHCFDRRRKNDVAIKTIIGQEKGSRGRLNKFIEEVKFRTELKLHPNVLSFDRILEIDGYYYIVSEWIEGSAKFGNSLTSWIKKGTFDQIFFINALIQICYGLQHCYDNISDFVFGDLKPDNILVSADGILKLADFSGGYTSRWASPEQLSGYPIDKRSDIYCFAKVACEMQNVCEVNDESLDDDLLQLLDECLEELPENRPSSISAVLKKLHEICIEHGITPYKPNEERNNFRDNFNRFAAESKVYGESKLAVSANAYMATSFITGKDFMRIDEYAEYVSSEEKTITEAHIQEKNGDVQAALHTLSASIQVLKKTNAIYLERARLFTLMGNINDAIKNYDVAILNGDSLEAYDLKADLLLDYPQMVGDHPEIPVLIERLSNMPENRYIGYLANQARAKYYFLSGQYKYASSYFRRSLQYPNVKEWRTLYYYGCCEEAQKNTEASKTLFLEVCDRLSKTDYIEDLDMSTKLLFASWKLKRKDEVERLIVFLLQKYQVDYSNLLCI